MDTTSFVAPGVITFVCYGLYQVAKVIVTAMICNHPELSDSKVESITKMFSSKRKTNLKV